MKKLFLFLMFGSVTSLFSRDVTGKVWVKENGAQKGIPGMLVSDGYNFAMTDEQGELRSLLTVAHGRSLSSVRMNILPMSRNSGSSCPARAVSSSR